MTLPLALAIGGLLAIGAFIYGVKSHSRSWICCGISLGMLTGTGFLWNYGFQDSPLTWITGAAALITGFVWKWIPD